MDADFSIELGPPGEDATLEFPWSSGVAGGPKYVDLKHHPELLSHLDEASRFPELVCFLKTANSRHSLVETAKCDAWFDAEAPEADQVYGAACFGSYVDLVFDSSEAESRFSFFRHEDIARALATLLKKAPDMAASIEVIVRRCYYRGARTQAGHAEVSRESRDTGNTDNGSPTVTGVREGFYFTLYVFGYGDDEAEARGRWRIALDLASNAILQLSMGERQPK